MQQVKSKSHIFPNFAGQDVFELENIISVEKCILVTLILLFFWKSDKHEIILQQFAEMP